MPRFIVHICEKVSVERSQVFEAQDEGEARQMAEATNWREWPEDDRYIQTYIDWIEEE